MLQALGGVCVSMLQALSGVYVSMLQALSGVCVTMLQALSGVCVTMLQAKRLLTFENVSKLQALSDTDTQAGGVNEPSSHVQVYREHMLLSTHSSMRTRSSRECPRACCVCVCVSTRLCVRVCMCVNAPVCVRVCV